MDSYNFTEMNNWKLFIAKLSFTLGNKHRAVA